MVLVVHEHPLLQQRQLLLVLGLGGLVGLGAEHRAGGLGLAEGDGVGRGADPLAEHHLAGDGAGVNMRNDQTESDYV